MIDPDTYNGRSTPLGSDEADLVIFEWKAPGQQDPRESIAVDLGLLLQEAECRKANRDLPRNVGHGANSLAA